MNPEQQRLEEARAYAAQSDGGQPWKKWGPYLSERQWGTVREDYEYYDNPIPYDDAWGDFPFHIAHARAYRWGEDGIAGISDDKQQLCFAIALWNGLDEFNRSYWVQGSSEPRVDKPFPLLKERLFGLTGNQGNHGEDVKEYYFYLDNTPSHAWMRYLYKYPQAGFPYFELIDTARDRNSRPGRGGPEFELLDTGVFEENRYFDVFVNYAKADPEDILVEIEIVNRGPEPSELHLLPTLWFRNTWSWDLYPERVPSRETFTLEKVETDSNFGKIAVKHPNPDIGGRWLYCDALDGSLPELLFTNNDSNPVLVNAMRPGLANSTSGYYKDAFHNYVIHGRKTAINPESFGTKAAPYYRLTVGAGETKTLRLRLSATDLDNPFGTFDGIVAARQQEADTFYANLSDRTKMSPDRQAVQRQAIAGLLWGKQCYLFDVQRWLDGDAPPLPQATNPRRNGRNAKWTHLNTEDVISMPDKWEYPWFAAWDLAFHTLPIALVDPDFAKDQLILMTREWYMHPNGQIPAYEWNYGDVNPAVHAWATWRVFRIEALYHDRAPDYAFLEQVFHKLLLNFTWWVNRKDAEGNNLFEGGFLGLDNISIFNRSEELPTGGTLEQSDGTSWMAMFCLNMLTISLELAAYHNPVYENIATKFFEHFIYISQAINDKMNGLWDREDNFFYDKLRLPDNNELTITLDGKPLPAGTKRAFVKLRSMVGLIPLYATMTMDAQLLEKVPGFIERLEWYLTHRKDLCSNIAHMQRADGSRLLSLVSREKLKKILQRLLDENEFLSDYGIRALSKAYDSSTDENENSYTLEFRRPATEEEVEKGRTQKIDGEIHKDEAGRYFLYWKKELSYLPAESDNFDFGGNSNWRGPIWFPVNQLLVDSLWKFYAYYGDNLTVSFPTGSEENVSLKDVVYRLSERLAALFEKSQTGDQRPIYGGMEIFQTDEHWRDCLLFNEYFHGDNGAGIGANHQTGWTGLIAYLIHELHTKERSPQGS